MQNRYVGDIGDYLKLGILRALSPGYRLGVAWWLFPDEAHNGDGRHISYLGRPDQWRHFDLELFDMLLGIVSSGRRNVWELEAANVLPGATFVSEFIPGGGPTAQRQQARRDWLEEIRRKLEPTDLLFLDPDNGLEPAGFRPTAAKSGKSIMISEVRQFAKTRAMPDRVSPPISPSWRPPCRDETLGRPPSSKWICYRRCSARQTVLAATLFSAGRAGSDSTTRQADRRGLAGLHHVASVAP